MVLGNRAIILAVGPVSSQFAELFVRAILQGPPHHGLIAVGVYDDDVAGSRVRRNIRKLAKRKGIKDISVAPKLDQTAQNPHLDALVDLKQLAQGLGPSRVFLIIDAEFAGNAQYASIFRDLRIASPQLEMTALCFTYNRNDAERNGHKRLLEFTQPDDILNGAPVLEGVFISRVDSPLAETVGGVPYQNDLLARSLAGIWSGPLYRNFNASLREQLRLLTQPAAGEQTSGFVGLGIAPKGLTMKRKPGIIGSISYFFYRKSLKRITVEWARENLTILARSVLTSNLEQAGLDSNGKRVDVVKATTTVQSFTPQAQPLLVNFMAPFRADDDRFEPIRAGVQQDLTEAGYQVIHTSMVTAKGVNLSHNRNFSAWKGTFYCQACILFAASGDEFMPASDETGATPVSHEDAQS